MSEEDIAQVREAYVRRREARAAHRLRCIELHMAHGYLIHSSSRRSPTGATMRYGGDPRRPHAFPLEVVRAVRAVVPKGMPLGARISGGDWMDGGLTIEDCACMGHAPEGQRPRFRLRLVRRRHAPTRARRPRRGYNVPFAEQIKRETGMATRAVGLIATAEAGRGDRRGGQGRHGGARPRHAGRSALGAGMRRQGSLAPTSRGRTQYLRAAPKLWPGATYRDTAA